jgi:hypothetical protein
VASAVKYAISSGAVKSLEQRRCLLPGKQRGPVKACVAGKGHGRVRPDQLSENSWDV